MNPSLAFLHGALCFWNGMDYSACPLGPAQSIYDWQCGFLNPLSLHEYDFMRGCYVSL